MIYKVYTDHYVAAVIESTVKLAKWLNRVPERTLKRLRIEPMTGQTSYPVKLLEYEYQDRRIFMHDPDGIVKGHLSGIPGIKLLATYTIEKDFLGDPKNPGLDYMGILNHDHELEDNCE